MKRILSVALALLLAACATSMNLHRLAPGSVTLEQMRAAQKPTAEWKNTDGTVTLEYSKQPVTAYNVMLDFDAKGVLKASRVVSQSENIDLLKTGMTRAEVQRLVGSPASIYKDSMTGGDVWEIPTEFPIEDAPQRAIIITWHPRVDGAVKIEMGNRYQ